MLILGAHMSIAGGFTQAAQKTGQDLQGHAMQIFTKSPRGGNIKPIDPDDSAQFKALCQEYAIQHVFAHSSYLLNFAKAIGDAEWMLKDIMTDFKRLHILGGKGVVVHIGKSLLDDRKNAIKNVIENAKYIIEATAKTEPLDYILENTAGQGSEIGFKLEELAEVWRGLEGFSPRIKTCLDTAHIWAAGYDIGTKATAQKLWQEYDEMIGIKNLACLHFNDSKKPLDSRLDRHENIGDGFIGLEGLTELANLAAKKSIPLILETPEKDGKMHGDDAETIKKMIQ
jgi:deoxyribonuclease IV